MPTKSSIPYIAPEGVVSAPSSILSDIPASEPVAPIAPPTEESLTLEQERTVVFAKMVVAYNALFGACKTLIARARPANKLKHNYFVCATDLEGVALEMDGEIAQILDKVLEAKEPAQEGKS